MGAPGPEWTITKTVRLSSRFTCEMTAGPAGFECLWDPATPVEMGLKATRREIARYKAGRDALLAEVGKRMGGSVLLIEI